MMYRHLTTDKHLSTHWQISSSLSEDEEEERRGDYYWLFSMPIEKEKDQMIIDTLEEEEEIRLTVLIESRRTRERERKRDEREA